MEAKIVSFFFLQRKAEVFGTLYNVSFRKCLLSFGADILFSRLLSKNLKIKIYRTIILPIVLYGCETWSLTSREERKLRVFENMVLRRI